MISLVYLYGATKGSLICFFCLQYVSMKEMKKNLKFLNQDWHDGVREAGPKHPRDSHTALRQSIHRRGQETI